MSSYIRESLSAGEKIYKITDYHWIYLLGSIIGATLFALFAFALIFIGIVYHYFDPVKLPPWHFFDAAAELSLTQYIKGFWHINPLFRVAAFILVLLGLIQVGARLLVVATTEMAVTNRRIVYKRGWISRRVEEMRIDYIEGADVRQTVMGRLLNYGRVSVSGTGSESIWYPRQMLDPIGFKRALEAARNTLYNAQRPGMPSTPDYHHPQHDADTVVQDRTDATKNPPIVPPNNT